MDDYAKFVLDRARVAARAPTQNREPAKAAAAAPPPPPKPARAAPAPLKRKLEAAEEVLARVTKEVEALDLQLADPSLYVKDPAKASELGQKRDKLQTRLDAAEAEWMACAEAYEAALADA
jgi:ATP-binding cassette subfamily F protein 3